MAIITYEHHGEKVFVDDRLKGKHRDDCLCFKCASFKPGTNRNCPKAQELYELCVRHGMTTPVYECPVFVEIKWAEPAAAGPEHPDCEYCQAGTAHVHTPTRKSTMVAVPEPIKVGASAFKNQ